MGQWVKLVKNFGSHYSTNVLHNATLIVDACWSQYTKTDRFLDLYYLDFNIACLLSSLLLLNKSVNKFVGSIVHSYVSVHTHDFGFDCLSACMQQ